MAHLEEFLMPVRELARDAFVRRYNTPFFICRSRPKVHDDDWRFTTQTVSSADVSAVARDLADAIVLAPEVAGCRVFAIQKSQTNPWRGRVSVGRARNNDIAIVDPSVSKLHAYAVVEPDGSTSLQDVGSRNGTMVNGKRLAEDEKVTLSSGDAVVFGRMDMLYVDAGGLYDFVKKNVQRKVKGE